MRSAHPTQVALTISSQPVRSSSSEVIQPAFIDGTSVPTGWAPAALIAGENSKA